MSVEPTNVIPFPLPRAPKCWHCGVRMALLRAQPDPNGGDYMFEMFACDPCRERRLNVRPLGRAPTSRVYEFGRLRPLRSAG